MPSVSTCTFILTPRLWRAFGLKIWTNSPGESSVFNLQSTVPQNGNKPKNFRHGVWTPESQLQHFERFKSQYEPSPYVYPTLHLGGTCIQPHLYTFNYNFTDSAQSNKIVHIPPAPSEDRHHIYIYIYIYIFIVLYIYIYITMSFLMHVDI